MPISVLTAAPYNLPYGSSVFARVTAINAYGTSVTSGSSNGAVILNLPSTVVVSNFAPGTDANQVTIQWTEPTETGGTPLLDYEIYYTIPTESF